MRYFDPRSTHTHVCSPPHRSVSISWDRTRCDVQACSTYTQITRAVASVPGHHFATDRSARKRAHLTMLVMKFLHVSGLPAKGHRRRVAVMTSAQIVYYTAIMSIISIVNHVLFILSLIMISSDFIQTP